MLREPYNPAGTDWERRALAAEKTAAVLQEKVLAMYAGSSNAGLYRQIERSREREAENRRRREQMEFRAQELERYSVHLEAEVARRTRAVQTILDHVTFGFLIVDRELKVREGFTRTCAELFGRPVSAGDGLEALLGLTCPSAMAQLQLGVDQVFEDLLPEEVSLGQLPSRFEVGGRILKMEVRVVREEAPVAGLLMTISDITALEAARRESRQHQVLVGILRQRPHFHQFVCDVRESLQAAMDRLDDSIFVRRVVHTVKGNAGSYGLDELVAACHRAEHGAEDPIDAEALARIAEALRAFLAEHHGVLEMDYDMVSRPTFEIGAHQLDRLRGIIAGLDDRHELTQWAAEVVQRPVREMIGPVRTFVERLAARLDKLVDLELVGEELLVDAEVLQPVFGTLAHLLRNALDHGIEPSGQRGHKGPRGKVRVEVDDDAHGWTIRVADDGRGIDLEQLARRAVDLGLETESSIASLDPQRRLALIFKDGLSTREEATDISGRGIGMSAVKAAVEARQGQILVATEPGAGTTITLWIPEPRRARRAAA